MLATPIPRLEMALAAYEDEQKRQYRAQASLLGVKLKDEEKPPTERLSREEVGAKVRGYFGAKAKKKAQ